MRELSCKHSKWSAACAVQYWIHTTRNIQSIHQSIPSVADVAICFEESRVWTGEWLYAFNFDLTCLLPERFRRRRLVITNDMPAWFRPTLRYSPWCCDTDLSLPLSLSLSLSLSQSLSLGKVLFVVITTVVMMVMWWSSPSKYCKHTTINITVEPQAVRLIAAWLPHIVWG